MSNIIPLRGDDFYRHQANIAYEKGMSAIVQSDYEGALSSFQTAYSLWPKHVDAYFYTGLIAYVLNQTEQAILIFQDLHESYPDNHEYTYRYARGLYGKEKEKEAIPLFESIPKTHEHYPQAQFYLAKSYYKQADSPKAVHILIALLSRYPERVDFRFELACIYAEIGKHHAALEALSVCLGIDCTYTLAYYLEHDIYLEMGDYKQAEQSLRTLSEACPAEKELAEHHIRILQSQYL